MMPMLNEYAEAQNCTPCTEVRCGARVCIAHFPGWKYQTFPGAYGTVLGRLDGMWRVRMDGSGHVLLFQAAELEAG